MDFKIFFIFTTFYICLCNGAVGILENSTNPDFPGKCWDPETKKPYDFNEEFFIENKCTKGFCKQGFEIEYHTCGAISIEGCKEIERDFTLPYPKCCHQFKCADGTIH